MAEQDQGQPSEWKSIWFDIANVIEPFFSSNPDLSGKIARQELAKKIREVLAKESFLLVSGKDAAAEAVIEEALERYVNKGLRQKFGYTPRYIVQWDLWNKGHVGGDPQDDDESWIGVGR